MKTVKSILTLIILISVISTICPAAGSQKKDEPNRPSAQELLKKYTETQESVKSVINKVQTIYEATFTDPSGRPAYRKEFNAIDTKWDGFRLSSAGLSGGLM